MTKVRRACAGALLAIITIVPATLDADTVQLTLQDGRVSLVAANATPAQILDAWSRVGGVLIVNAERVPAAPVTLTLDNVPEEQALDTLLRPVSGYLARRRVTPDESGSVSVFDRIVILATPSVARETTPAAPPVSGPVRPGAPPAATVFPQPPRSVVAQPMPVPPSQGAPAPGAAPPVSRIIGADGQPVEDDQDGAPPQPVTPAPPFNGGDPADGRSPGAPPRMMPGPVPQQPAQPSSPTSPPATSAPVGVPRPGMAVPVPQPAQQPR